MKAKRLNNVQKRLGRLFATSSGAERTAALEHLSKLQASDHSKGD
jgi:hypothetical protein